MWRNKDEGIANFAAHMAVACILIALASGSAAFLVARVFVKKIYERVKFD